MNWLLKRIIVLSYLNDISPKLRGAKIESGEAGREHYYAIFFKLTTECQWAE